jgi:hypothetical protein
MTLFYAATQHFCGQLAIIVQASVAGHVFTIRCGSLLFG